MSEMIEHVARAIGESLYGLCDPRETPNTWAQAVSAARAAIEAMREPTEAMCQAGADAADDSGMYAQPTTGDFRRGYPAMIDAAMADPHASDPANDIRGNRMNSSAE